jgi:CheY-like chemotaxis protein
MRRPPRPPASTPTRVLLVSAHAPARDTLRRLLELEDDLAVVGAVSTGAAALQLVPRVRPDVVLTDVQLPDRDGLTVALALRYAYPAVAVLLLGLFDDEELAGRAARAGRGATWPRPPPPASSSPRCAAPARRRAPWCRHRRAPWRRGGARRAPPRPELLRA